MCTHVSTESCVWGVADIDVCTPCADMYADVRLQLPGVVRAHSSAQQQDSWTVVSLLIQRM